MRSRVWLPAGIFAAAALLSASYAADPLPKDTLAGCAVSAPNGKLGAAGGTANNVNGDTGRTDFGQLTGSYSVPLGCAFGLQADGSLTSSGGGTWGGVAAHLFYRDPAKYLLGASASYETGHGTGQIFRIGPEVELYISNVNIEAWAGWASMAGGASDWFAAVDAALYPTENLRLSAGWRHSFGTDVAVGRAELQVDDDKPVSVFAEGRIGAGGYSVIKGGVNVYFGDTGKTLLQRRRTGDPQNWLFDLLAAKANGGGSSDTGGGTCTRDRDCTLGEHCSSGTCTPAPPPSDYCGDGIVTGSEQCDEGPANGVGGTCSLGCRDIE